MKSKKELRSYTTYTKEEAYKANWKEEFDKRTNPMGRDYYWLTGKFINMDHGEDTDEWALEHGYVSVVPVQFDLTAHHSIEHLNTWDFK